MFREKVKMGKGWGVLGVDIQNDFVSGSLAVTEGAAVIEPTNRITDIARRRYVPIAMSADWHPRQTTHFAEFGGPWPVHCVQFTEGAALDKRLETQGAEIFHKGMSTKDDGYSPWEGISPKKETLDEYLQRFGVKKLIVTGLATDYCVKAGVLDALKKRNRFGFRRYKVYVVEDAIRAVDIHPDDGSQAIAQMKKQGAKFIRSEDIT